MIILYNFKIKTYVVANLTVTASHLSKGLWLSVSVLYFFSYKTGFFFFSFFFFQNNPQNVDLSYKMDLDPWD